MNRIKDQTISKFREILRQFEREIFFHNMESCCNSVTLAQCHTLLEIQSKAKISVTELAKTLSLDKSTVSRTIDGLVNIGLVDRSIPSENRRMATLCLTEEGKNTCQSINCYNNKYFEFALSVLTGSEQEELISLFEKITGRMIEARAANLKTDQDNNCNC